MHSAIKKIGIYNINIKLHAEVSCDLQINVATSIENANLQKSEAEKTDKNEQAKKDNKNEDTLENKDLDNESKAVKTKKPKLNQKK